MKKIFAFNFPLGELFFFSYSMRWNYNAFYFLISNNNAFFRSPGYCDYGFYYSKNIIKLFKTV